MITGTVLSSVGRRGASSAFRGFSSTARRCAVSPSANAGVSPSPASAPSGPGAGVPPAAPASAVPVAKATPLVVPVTTPPPPPKAPKKKTSLTGLLLKTLLFVSAVYGGTLYVATKNDKVLDFVIDNQLPYHEELIDLIEKGSLEDIQAKFNELQSSVSNFQFKLPTVEEIKDKFEKPTRVIPSKQSTFTPAVGTPAEQLQRPVETKFPSASSVLEKLPLIQLKDGVALDETVKSTIDSFNNLISSISSSSATGNKEVLLKSINEQITQLSSKLKGLTDDFDNELTKKLKLSQTDLLSSYTKKELELTENFLHQFNQEKIQLEKKLNVQLLHEIESTKETMAQAAVNAVSLMRIEQTKSFENLIKDKVDQERNGRLNNLTNINSRLEKLEKFATDLENQLVSNHQKGKVQHSLSKVKALIFNPNYKNEQPVLLENFISDLNENISRSDNELLKLASSDLISITSKESSHSILNSSQLLTRWEELSPELRSASLLPPNAGLLGHFSSIIFSKLLIPTKGSKPDGKDIESVIGRVEQLLSRGQLDVAVEEVANLKGWSRKLANDWVIEGRKRLEVEFLVNLIDSESRLL